MSATAPASLPSDSRENRNFAIFTGIVSTVALGVIAWILLFRGGSPDGTLDLRFMPAINASLNALSTTLLAAGWWCIKHGRQRAHQYLMVSAFASSALFLVGYLAYHYVHGDTKFTGTGGIRIAYFAILITHVLLSMLVVPMAFFAFFFAWRRSFAKHRKVTRILAPVWLYVSVTGVVIFFMLRGSPPVSP